MAVKFSQFTNKTTTADVTAMVGYFSTGDLNIRIDPAELDTTYGLTTEQNSSDIDFTLTGTKGTGSPAAETVLFKAGSNITLTAAADEIEIAATDTNTTYIFESVANASNIDLTLTGADPTTTDTVLVTAAGGISFSSVGPGGFTISSAIGGGWTADGDSGSFAVSDGGSIDFLGGDAITTTAAAGPQVTFDLDDTGVTYAKIQDVAANSLLVRDANSAGVLSAKALATTEILIGNGTGFTAASLGTDVTMDNAGAVTIANDAVVTAKILDANVTHAKLENRYTEINPIGPTVGAFDIDWSLGAIQTFTLGGNHTGTFTNFKVGTTIDIILSGNYTLTFDATASGTAAMRKVGGVDYDGSSSDQIIQVVCASADSTTPIFYYNCATWVTDTQP